MSTVLNTVYNNYLTTYTPKTLTRYDAHKKSELRSVYNSIVKLNKESPWYLPTTNKDTLNYAVDLKENARELRNTIAQLGGLEEEGLLTKKGAFTSDPEVATATYIGSSTSATDSLNFSLEVESLASSQENMGLFLENTPVDLASGTYSFDVSINDMNYEFQFSIGETETNREVQERLARLINNSGIGMKASIVESDSRSALRLVSESTGISLGKTQIFSISDNRTSKASGSVEYFGLDYTSRHASNAHFSINGESKTAFSNHFTIGKQFEIQLHSVTPEDKPVEIGLKTDVESLTDNVSHLIVGYNDFLKAASSYLDSQSKSRQLVREMNGIVSLYQPSMEAMGLRLTEDGTMSINSEELKQAATESEDVSQTFGFLKDFSDSLLRKSNQVSLNPMEYVEKKIVAYKNPGHNYPNPYSTSAYTGMMFNGYC